MSVDPSIPTSNRWSTIGLLMAFVGLGVAVWGLYQGIATHDSRLVISWLLGFGFWFSVLVGLLFIVMIWYAFGSGWSAVVRRQLEHALAFFPWLALVLAPLIIIGWLGNDEAGILWHWMNPDYLLPSGHAVGHDPLYEDKSAFLNKEAFTLRLIVYFLFFCGWAYALRRSSFKLDSDYQLKWPKMGYRFAVIGIPICAILATFAVFDLFMSLSYHWFSTMYGVWFFATSMRAALAVTVIICFLLSREGRALQGIYNRGHQYNLACLCLAFTVFWAYISFSQYFLIYNGNIPEETFWFNIRELGADWGKSAWWYVGAYGLIFGYFFFPFLYLLGYHNKVKPKRLLFICVWILAFHLLDLYFNIVPGQITADNPVGYTVRPFSVTLYDVAMLIGLTGLFIWVFTRSMRKQKIIPIHDPFIQESLQYHE